MTVQQTFKAAYEQPWTPIPGSSQMLVLRSRADITMYTGTRGPGKTDTQLFKFKRRVGVGYGMYWRGIIFDREYKNLDDIVNKSKRWFSRYDDGAKWYSSKSDYKWVWPTGEELLIRAVKDKGDYWNYHGQEFPFVGWNELTKYPTSDLFDSMFSINRSSYTPEKDTPVNPVIDINGRVICDRDAGLLLPDIPLEVLPTTNPYGAGHNWVKRRFIDVAPFGQLVKSHIEVFDPKTQKDTTITKTQVTIFGNYRENIYLDAKYVANLKENSNVEQRKAWFAGSWDIVVGGMFGDVWDKNCHIVMPFQIPATWRIDRSFDWGSSKPFSVGWWAESDGSDYYRDGKAYSTVRGDLFRIAEWYGCLPKQPNVGLKKLAVDVAQGIVERQLALGIHNRVKAGPADSAIYAAENGMCIATDMAKPVKVGDKMLPGVQWSKADKSPGSRKTGWEACRKMLEYGKRKKGLPREFPGLFAFATCVDYINLFPILPRDDDDPDDVDTDAEDHIGDEVRYRVRAVGRQVTQTTSIGGY